jgi:serine/threonine-protein kinase
VSPAAAPGRVLGDRYRLVRPIARGGMASVWVGDDVLLSRRVAVKTLHPELAVDDALRARFRREAIAAAKLGHPDIVATYDTGEDGDVSYIVMELVDGPTLRAALDQEGPMPVARALRIAREVAAALDHAHRHGVIHRDIKPANVLIPPEGPVKVTDFGIAKAAGASDLTRTGTVVGTARYLAPEQVEGGVSDARTDIYAVGLLLYEMLVGRLPFGGDTEMAAAIARVTAAAPGVRSSRPDVPVEVDAVVARCLERDPEERYQHAAELAAALDAAGSSPGTPLASPLGAGGPTAPRASVFAATTGPTPVPGTHAPTAVESRPVVTDPGGPRPDIQRAAPRRRRRTSLVPIVLLLVVIVGGVAFLVSRALDDGSDSGGGSNGGTGGAKATITAANDFDPFGNDHSEHHELVGDVFDGNDGTAWTTSQYANPTMDKPGVGIYVQLSAPTRVSRVEVDTKESGWNGAIYVADSPGATLAAWGQPVAQQQGAGPNARFTPQPQKTAKYVLLWITRLPATTPHQLQVEEIRVR